MQTYTMKFECSNCFEVYIREVERGKRAGGKGGECPYCGIIDNPKFELFKYWKANQLKTKEANSPLADKEE